MLLLLQSSDRIAHDVCHAYDGCSNGAGGPTSSSTLSEGQQQQTPAVAGDGSVLGWRPALALVLRKWCEMRPGREFRCFVRQREIVGDPPIPPPPSPPCASPQPPAVTHVAAAASWIIGMARRSMERAAALYASLSEMWNTS